MIHRYPTKPLEIVKALYPFFIAAILLVIFLIIPLGKILLTYLMVIVPYILTLIKSPIYYLVLLIVMTLIVAAITLLERKALSLSQRRVGPNFVGYKGRLQYLADALKLFLKGFIVPIEVNKFMFILCPSLVFTTCYTF